MAFRAVHRHARISARKVRPLADLVRGKFADEALALLKYQPNRGARMLEKVSRAPSEMRKTPNKTVVDRIPWKSWSLSMHESTADRCSSDFVRCRGDKHLLFSDDRRT